METWDHKMTDDESESDADEEADADDERDVDIDIDADALLADADTCATAGCTRPPETVIYWTDLGEGHANCGECARRALADYPHVAIERGNGD